jgi:hypothetical protein
VDGNWLPGHWERQAASDHDNGSQNGNPGNGSQNGNPGNGSQSGNPGNDKGNTGDKVNSPALSAAMGAAPAAAPVAADPPGCVYERSVRKQPGGGLQRVIVKICPDA